MKTLVVHLAFNGNCEEAINFYKDCFGGEIVSKQTYGESPMQFEEKDKSRIMHAVFKADGIQFMAADAMPDMPATEGTNITLSLDVQNEKEQDSLFNKLSSGGQVKMPLQDTFWNARFGMLKDKYGINWMLNCNKLTA